MKHSERALLEGIERLRNVRYDLFDANELHYQVGRLLDACTLLQEQNLALRVAARHLGNDTFEGDGRFITVEKSRLLALLRVVIGQETTSAVTEAAI